MAVGVRIFPICLGGRVEFRRKVALDSHRNLASIYCYTILNHLLVFIHVNHILNASTHQWLLVFASQLRRDHLIPQTRSRVLIN